LKRSVFLSGIEAKGSENGSEKAGDWWLSGVVSAENAVCEVTGQSGEICLEGLFTP
jgi:hypothetical protein